MNKYNQKYKKSEEQPKFMKYNNVHKDTSKVKKFIIDTWELEDNLFLDKKKIGEKEQRDILEKDNSKLLQKNNKDVVVLERNRQFSFQHISKSEKKHPKKEGHNKKEIGGLLNTLGKYGLSQLIADTKEILNKKINSHVKVKKFGRFSVQEVVKKSSGLMDIFGLKQSLSEELSSISNKNNKIFSKNLSISKKKKKQKEKTFEIKLENTGVITNRPKNFTFSQKPVISNKLKAKSNKKTLQDPVNLNPMSKKSEQIFKKHNLFMKKQNKDPHVNIYSKITPENTKRHNITHVYSDTKVIQSNKLSHLNSFPINSVEKSKQKYNFFKTNSNIIKNSKMEDNSITSENKPKHESRNSINKLKKIVSIDTEINSINSDSIQPQNYKKNFLSKQITLKDSELSISKPSYLTKTKSYTKFVDFFKDSSRHIEDKTKHYVKRKTSIKSKQSETSSIHTINSSLQNNDFSSYNIPKKKEQIGIMFKTTNMKIRYL